LLCQLFRSERTTVRGLDPILRDSAISSAHFSNEAGDSGRVRERVINERARFVEDEPHAGREVIDPDIRQDVSRQRLNME
jgi:hypothetical protein